MRYLLLFTLLLLSFASSAHDNAPEQLQCKGHLYELKEGEFNAIVRAEEENNEMIKQIETEISISVLSASEKSKLLAELHQFSQTSTEKISCVLDFQPAVSNGIYKELKSVRESLQTDYAKFRARFQNQNQQAEKQLAGQQRLERIKNARMLRDLEQDPSLLQPNRAYVVSDAPSASLKTVTFNEEVVEYLQNDPKGSQFLKVIDNGIVAPQGEAGVKRFKANIYSVKLVGPRQNDRLYGCYKSGALEIKLAESKRSSDNLNPNAFDYLCKK